MNRLLQLTAGLGLAAAVSPWLPGVPPGLAWSSLFAGYATVLTRASACMRSQLLGTALCTLPQSSDTVALTFDDGPDPAATPMLLDLLREHRARATFFCVGERVRAAPAIVRRMHEEGHALGNHGDRHRWWAPCQFGEHLRRDLLACQLAIADAAGITPIWFRPPFGVRTHATHSTCARLGLQVVGWNVRSLDLPNAAPERVAARVLAQLHSGDIVLLHDGDRQPARVVATAARILAGMADRGLRSLSLDAK